MRNVLHFLPKLNTRDSFSQLYLRAAGTCSSCSTSAGMETDNEYEDVFKQGDESHIKEDDIPGRNIQSMSKMSNGDRQFDQTRATKKLLVEVYHDLEVTGPKIEDFLGCSNDLCGNLQNC